MRWSLPLSHPLDQEAKNPSLQRFFERRGKEEGRVERKSKWANEAKERSKRVSQHPSEQSDPEFQQPVQSDEASPSESPLSLPLPEEHLEHLPTWLRGEILAGEQEARQAKSASKPPSLPGEAEPVHPLLGTLRMVYHRPTIQNLLTSLVIIGLGAGWTVLMGTLLQAEVSPSGVELFAPWVGVLILLGGIGWAIPTVASRSIRVSVYAEGLVSHRDEVLRWDQVASVWHRVRLTTHRGVPQRFVHSYLVQRADGTTILFGEFIGGVRDLGRMIELGSAQHLLPQAQAAFDAGEPVSFGPIKVHPAGISNGEQILEWGDLKGIEVDEAVGLVSLRQKGKRWAWSTIRFSDMPNVLVFEKLVNAILASQAS